MKNNELKLKLKKVTISNLSGHQMNNVKAGLEEGDPNNTKVTCPKTGADTPETEHKFINGTQGYTGCDSCVCPAPYDPPQGG